MNTSNNVISISKRQWTDDAWETLMESMEPEPVKSASAEAFTPEEIRLQTGFRIGLSRQLLDLLDANSPDRPIG